jgi:hypothetical protein
MLCFLNLSFFTCFGRSDDLQKDLTPFSPFKATEVSEVAFHLLSRWLLARLIVIP